MNIVAQSYLDALLLEYAPSSPLWTLYPEFTQEEREQVVALGKLDRPIVHALCFREARRVAPGQPRIYLATAGAPAAGKSTLLEQEIHSNPRYRGLVRIDPDIYAMRAMVHTYHDFLLSPRMLLVRSPSQLDPHRRAYDVARPWSNILATEVLNEAAAGPYGIAHGTTMTAPVSANLLRSIKQTGREIDLLVCYASHAVRIAAVRQRVESHGRYQASPQDVIEKGLLFPLRFPVYFGEADNLVLFWRSAHDAPAIRAAEYSRGRRHIIDADAFDCFRHQYQAERVELARDPPPPFDDLEAWFRARFPSEATLDP